VVEINDKTGRDVLVPPRRMNGLVNRHRRQTSSGTSRVKSKSCQAGGDLGVGEGVLTSRGTQQAQQQQAQQLSLSLSPVRSVGSNKQRRRAASCSSQSTSPLKSEKRVGKKVGR
jgi:hypothetical protein